MDWMRISGSIDKFSGVYAYGFERPSAIQQRAIMPIIKGKLRDGDMLQKLKYFW